MTREEILGIRTQVKGAREAAADLDKVSGGVDRVGREADKAGEKVERGSRRLSLFSRTAQHSRGPLSSLTRSVLGFTGAFAAISALKSSVNTTEDLGRSALSLARNLGLSDEAAVRWAGTAKLRGIDTAALGKTGAFLGKQMIAAANGSDKANAAFEAFGVTQETIKKGDFTQALLEMADGYAAMPNGVRKTALAQQLLSRGAATLTPLLSSGSKGLSEQLGLMDKYSVTALAAGQGGLKDFIAKQRESQAATLGFQVAVGTNLLPILTTLMGFLPSLSQAIKEGDGAFGILKTTIEGVVGAVRGTIDFFGENEAAAKILTGGIIGLVAAYVLTKGILIGTTAVMKIHTLWVGATTLATSEMTAGQWALNAALTGNPIMLTVLALIALAAGFVVAYKKVGWFREAVDATFSWIRDHWKLLTVIMFGPLGAAVVLIVNHWRPIVGFFRGIWDKVVAVFEAAYGKIKPIMEAVAGFADGVGSFFGLDGGPSEASINGARRALGLPTTSPTSQQTPGANPSLQARGGITRRGGLSWVGERGPELLSLPAGATVIPRNRAALVSPLPSGDPAAAGDARVLEVHTHLHLDGREIAIATSRHVAAAGARR